MIGTWENLAKTKMVKWQGWAMYYWDMGYMVALSKQEPQKDEDGRYGFDNVIEGIDPYFLRACGITMPFEGTHEHATNFYYDDDISDGCGTHNPIQITLTLPKALLEQLGL